ncbi:MAG: NUDIX domain-containing protein [Acidiferrobacterales bacterium]|nr:NUDIX domain-containing protein [Acidiferrobacterales bacterium]
MKYCLFVASLLFSGVAFSGSAGVVPYACIEDGAYVLLAFDPKPSRQSYAAFSGGDKEGESLAETAAREFNEETRCVFDGPDANQLSTMKPSMDHGHATFVAEVPFTSPLIFPDHPCEARVERSDWLWVRWTDLHKALSTDEREPEVVASLAHKYIKIWDKAADSMRGAMRDGLLPEKGLCKSEL